MPGRVAAPLCRDVRMGCLMEDEDAMLERVLLLGALNRYVGLFRRLLNEAENVDNIALSFARREEID